MLVLVLLPVIVAQDSSEAFVGYSDESDEVVVEVSNPIYEIEYAQDDVSLFYERGEEISEEEYIEDVPVHDYSTEIEDAIIIEEQIECSAVETHDIVDEINEENEVNVYCENVIDNVNCNDDIDLDSDRDVTIGNVSIKHGFIIFISEEFKHDIILINELTEAANYETYCFKRSLIKVFELKNNLLINQDVLFVFADYFIADVDEDIIICTDKLKTDFVFSIDNSVVGDENLIIFLTTSFCLNFTPCFDTFICCNFLGFESFFDCNNNYFIVNSYFNVGILYARLVKACLKTF